MTRLAAAICWEIISRLDGFERMVSEDHLNMGCVSNSSFDPKLDVCSAAKVVARQMFVEHVEPSYKLRM